MNKIQFNINVIVCNVHLEQQISEFIHDWGYKWLLVFSIKKRHYCKDVQRSLFKITTIIPQFILRF